MTDLCEPEVVVPCEGNCETVLQDLFINLCNLIVESRIPGVNERGYGDGCHCPPLMGPSTHKCDHSKLECQKHQRLIHHLIRAIKRNVFEIEVLMLPDCCTEPKLTERIQNKEYLLLERWSLNCNTCKGQSNIEVPQLLRAVRSFLHFSQISAWLSSTKGKSPANIYYRVKPNGEGCATNFEREPEVHSFPICKISEDLFGCVTVKYPPRTQYVPIIPCSKNPPLRGYSFRTLDDTNLCPTLPLNPQIVRQLQITCDTTQSTPIAKTFVPEPPTLLLTPVSLLKTLGSKVSDGNISNRILKHSNCQNDIINTSDITLDLSKSKNIDMISKSQTAFVVCNYTESCSQVQSQESVCFRKRQLAMHLHKAGLKLRKLNPDLSADYKIIPDSLQPSSTIHNLATGRVSTKDCSFQVSSSLSVASKCSQFGNNSAASSEKDMTCGNHIKYLKKIKTASKRKRNADQSSMLPQKKIRCDTHSSSQLFNSTSSELNQKTISNQNIYASHVETEIPALVSPALNSELEGSSSQTYITCCVSHLKSAPNIKQNFHEKDFSNYTPGTSSLKEKMFGQSKNSNSQNHARKRKRASHQNFTTIVNHKLKPNLSICNSFQRNMSNETIYSSEFNTRKGCNTANECTLNDYSSLSCSLNTEPKSIKQNFSMNLSESENESTDVKSSDAGKNIKNKCINKFQTMSKESLMKSSKIVSQGKARNSHSSSYVNSQFESLDCSGSKDFDHSSNKKGRSINDPCELCINEDYKIVNTQNKVCQSDSKLTLKPFTTELLKTNRSDKIRSKSCNISSRNHRALKNRHDKGIFRKMCNFECEPSLCKKRKVENVNKIDDRLQYTLPKTATINISQEFSSSNNSEHEGISHDQALQMLTSDSKNSILQKSGTTSIPLMISHQNDKTSTLYQPSNAYRTSLYQATNENLECFPKHATKFPKARKLLINFEESILKGCLPTVNRVKGFYAEIGASGSFCPNHLTLPADVHFYELGNSNQGAAPYVAHINLGNVEYYLSKKGAVQVTLFNPSETVVKMFVLNYDLSNMPSLCHTFIRQKIFYLPIGSKEENLQKSQKWLRFIIHLRFASTKTGKIYLHKDFKIVVLNKSNDDAASEFSQEPRELRSFLSLPMNPTFSSI